MTSPDPRSPLVYDIRVLGRRAGTMDESSRAVRLADDWLGPAASLDWLLGKLAQEKAAMPICPVHHRCDREAAGERCRGLHLGITCCGAMVPARAHRVAQSVWSFSSVLAKAKKSRVQRGQG